MNWRRILTVLAGVVPAIGSAADMLPGWVGVAGGIIAGTAINAEKYLAKRAKGSEPFDTAKARAAVDKMGSK